MTMSHGDPSVLQLEEHAISPIERKNQLQIRVGIAAPSMSLTCSLLMDSIPRLHYEGGEERVGRKDSKIGMTFKTGPHRYGRKP
jgi:hypothetical protein